MGNQYQKVRSHRDLDVYKMGFEGAMKIFRLSRVFPKVEEVFNKVCH
jgi:hypothetical protein